MSALSNQINETLFNKNEEFHIVKKIKLQNNSDLSDSQSQLSNAKDQEESKSISLQFINIPISTETLSNLDKQRKRPKNSPSGGVIEFMKDYGNDPSSFIDTYQVLKYKGQSYHLKDNLLIKNEADANSDFICQLTRIIRPVNLESSKVLAFLEVQWYYRKTDLQSKKYASYMAHFSENEVFATNQKDFVLVDCINGPAEVLTYNEYDSLSRINPHTYFSRSKFDVIKKKLIPSVEKWEKHCICKTPLNPDYMYVQCDVCGLWYHIMCLGLSVGEAQTMDTYICKECENQGKTEEFIKNETTKFVQTPQTDDEPMTKDGKNELSKP